jgi:hypothetical protein
MFLEAHVYYYHSVLGADMLHLNIETTAATDKVALHSHLDSFAGREVTRTPLVNVSSLFATVDITTRLSPCGFTLTTVEYTVKTEITTTLETVATRNALTDLYSKLGQQTTLRMFGDADEFLHIADDIEAVKRARRVIHAHLLEFKPRPTKFTVTDADQYEWVDQPYFYRARMQQLTYPAYKFDCELYFTKLPRKCHSGPFVEHKKLLDITGLRDPDRYREVLHTTDFLYHMSTLSKEYLLNTKHFNQVTQTGAYITDRNTTALSAAFDRYYTSPEKDYIVFRDSFLKPFFVPAL